MVKRLKSDKDGWGRRLFQSWLNRRIPPVSRLALSHKNVFILPSRTGWAFAGLLLAMLLTAINYQNSLIYGLTFWLVSLGHGTIWLTFRNLSGLEMSAGKVEPCYAGESLQLPLNVSSAKHWSVAITVGYPGETEQDFTLSPGESLDVAIARQTRKRGRLPLRRIRIETEYPFGLFRAWSWVALDFDVVIYPKPEYTPVHLSVGDGDELEGSTLALIGQDDISGIREYGRGDSLNQISWKHTARSGSPKSFEREQEQGVMCQLDWGSLTGLEPEVRLSRLASWVDQAEALGWKYGLSIPGVEIPAGTGNEHRHRCLTALAVWGTE
ncbi:MAG: DUF58 domain-containing protein [Oceanospirillaceae bacterium]|nr:DUF58 domain-containing protein [Oceanospirillaceae bacterium]|tara:strand:- start:1429 stop:2403 length:975 start_codon:yes stop_codon:yes gene_type:complete